VPRTSKRPDVRPCVTAARVAAGAARLIDRFL
jgi:hypothetical protein